MWRSVLTLYFCCCCHWCLLVLHNIFEYDKKGYIITIYHTFVACAFIFSDLQEKKRKKKLSIWANVIQEPFRPICWFLRPQRHIAFFYVMIYLTEQCNRRTVHYSLVGKTKHAVCSWSVRGHPQTLWCCPSFPHCSFCRGQSLTDSSKRHLGPGFPFYLETRFCIRTISSCHIWCALF